MVLPRSVVIPQLAGVGNAVWFMPTIRQLARAGVERIVVVARGRSIGGVFESMREVTRVDVVQASDVGGFASVLRGFASVLRALRRERADACIVPYPSNRWQYSVLAAACGARHVIVNGYPVGRWAALHGLVRDRVPAVRGVHDVGQNLRLLASLGIAPDLADAPRFDVDDAMRDAATRLLATAGVAGKPFVVLHAGSGATIFGEQKRWPVARFAEVARRIVDELSLHAAAVEGPDEPGVSRAVADLARRSECVPLRLACPIGASAATCAASAFYVGNDSALGHLAAAVGRRAVTVFGPTDPTTCAPFGNADLVVRPAKSCSPCFRYPLDATLPRVRCTKRPYCVESIEVGAVMDAVRRAARSSTASG